MWADRPVLPPPPGPGEALRGPLRTGAGGRPRRRWRGRGGAAGSWGSAAGGTARHGTAQHSTAVRVPQPSARRLLVPAEHGAGDSPEGAARAAGPAAFPRGNFNLARLGRRLSSSHVCAASENLFHPSGGKRSRGWDNKHFSFKRGSWSCPALSSDNVIRWKLKGCSFQSLVSQP